MRVIYFTCILIIVLGYACANYILTSFDEIENNNGNDEWSQLSAHFSPVIVNELKEFITLIPREKLLDLIAQHELLDKNFRHALEYVRSDAFPRLMQQLLNFTEITEILNYLNLLVNSTTPTMTATMRTTSPDFDMQGNELVLSGSKTDRRVDVYALLLDARNPIPRSISASSPHYTVLSQYREKHSANSDITTSEEVLAESLQPVTGWVRLWIRRLESFTQFVRELTDCIPRARFVEMITVKRKRTTEFEQFYTALRNSSFRPMVDRVLKSSNLSPILKTLSQHSIEVKELEPIAFNVISWGPAP